MPVVYITTNPSNSGSVNVRHKTFHFYNSANRGGKKNAFSTSPHMFYANHVLKRLIRGRRTANNIFQHIPNTQKNIYRTRIKNLVGGGSNADAKARTMIKATLTSRERSSRRSHLQRGGGHALQTVFYQLLNRLIGSNGPVISRNNRQQGRSLAGVTHNALLVQKLKNYYSQIHNDRPVNSTLTRQIFNHLRRINISVPINAGPRPRNNNGGSNSNTSKSSNGNTRLRANAPVFVPRNLRNLLNSLEKK